MTAALLERPASIFEPPAPRGRVTLEALLTATLAEARANGSSECPVCHARMAPASAGAPGAAPAAECGGCGSRLS